MVVNGPKEVFRIKVTFFFPSSVSSFAPDFNESQTRSVWFLYLISDWRPVPPIVLRFLGGLSPLFMLPWSPSWKTSFSSSPEEPFFVPPHHRYLAGPSAIRSPPVLVFHEALV